MLSCEVSVVHLANVTSNFTNRCGTARCSNSVGMPIYGTRLHLSKQNKKSHSSLVHVQNGNEAPGLASAQTEDTLSQEI